MARSGNRSIEAYRFPTSEPDKFIEVKVAYSEGGINWLGGTNDRAYYMHVTPIEIEQYQGAEIKKFMMFRGCKYQMEEAKRYNEKRILNLVEQVRQDCEARMPHIMRLVNHVLTEENLTLQEAVAT
jgi:hypothetical protein